MKARILLVIGLILPVIMLTVPNSVLAIDVLKPVCEASTDNPNPPTNSVVCQKPPNENPIIGPRGVLTRAIQIIAAVVGVAAIFVMVISGVRMILSGGDPARVSSARNGAIFALVGIALALVAQAIVTFVLKRLS